MSVQVYGCNHVAIEVDDVEHGVEILRHRAEVRRVGVAFEVPAARLTSLRLTAASGSG